MRALPRTAAATVAFAVAVSAAAVVLAGGRRGGEPAAPADHVPTAPASPPVDTGMNYRDPTAVCLRFADAVHRRDTRTDAGPQDAYRRAMAYATGDLAAAVAAQPPGRDPAWTIWRAHRAATDPTVTTAPAGGDVRPADTVIESYRAALVVLTPVGVDGWRGPTERRLVLCTLRRDGDDWRIETYQISEPADTP